MDSLDLLIDDWVEPQYQSESLLCHKPSLASRASFVYPPDKWLIAYFDGLYGEICYDASHTWRGRRQPRESDHPD